MLPQFRRQGRGVLINVASVYSRVAGPYLSAYVASKHAVRALSESLRQELPGVDGIRVCTVSPSAIDTPLFGHTANYTGRAVKPPPPVYPPELVAKAIVATALRPRRERIVGSAGRQLNLLPEPDPAGSRPGGRRTTVTAMDSRSSGQPRRDSPAALRRLLASWRGWLRPRLRYPQAGGGQVAVDGGRVIDRDTLAG